ncbi:Asp-tRNA(Asn)/Glu-tRNA(Gln) amidotransferase subunit GatC, partial [Acinetobacter baumannii]
YTLFCWLHEWGRVNGFCQSRFEKGREKINDTDNSFGLPFIKSVGEVIGFRLFLFDMKVTQEMIDNLSHLARLDFSEDEKKDLEKDLSKMIS